MLSIINSLQLQDRLEKNQVITYISQLLEFVYEIVEKLENIEGTAENAGYHFANSLIPCGCYYPGST